MGNRNGKQLILRVDAGTHIGAGHLMRCMALAQAWKDAGGQVIFITACQAEGLLQRLRDEEFEIKLLSKAYPDTADWNFTGGILAGHPDAWVVLDGYHFDEFYQRQVRKARHRLLVIDDMAHLKHYHVDVLLNQNLHAEQLQYVCEPDTLLLLGTNYILLRREFFAWKGWTREIPEVACCVLITLGGGDPENNTLKLIHALQESGTTDLEAVVVIGAGNPNASVLEKAAKQSRIPISLVRDAKNMPELMARADVAVSAGGSTAWELAYMGLPNLVLVLAENQRAIAEGLQAQGVGVNIGQPALVAEREIGNVLITLMHDTARRREMSERGRQLVDGCGAAKVVAILEGAN